MGAGLRGRPAAAPRRRRRGGVDAAACEACAACELTAATTAALTWVSTDCRVAREIIGRFLASGKDVAFTTAAFIAELVMRLTLVKYMGYVNSEESPYRYDFAADRWTMPPTWKNVPGLDSDDERNDTVAFAPKIPDKSYEAVVDLFSRAPSESYYADCSTTIVALHYRALAEALEKNAFNRTFAGKVATAPAGVQTGNAEGEFDDPPITGLVTLIPGRDIASLDELLPGDWVYFENYPDYDETHKGPSAVWAGEHAVYMGNGEYQGFGVERQPYDAMVKKMIDNYNGQGIKPGVKARSAVEDHSGSIGKSIPGITEVRRLKNPVE
ncbi:hypothetical protein [Kitasatospora mediocidica]|uniref:hypothetical protein n=1 Tax=Kitasatospora mediocidica TaxID=58352 RepID=UPI00068FF124|nr:hypothetical protein [Kitasatospora mediocidica]